MSDYLAGLIPGNYVLQVGRLNQWAALSPLFLLRHHRRDGALNNTVATKLQVYMAPL